MFSPVGRSFATNRKRRLAVRKSPEGINLMPVGLYSQLLGHFSSKKHSIFHGLFLEAENLSYGQSLISWTRNRMRLDGYASLGIILGSGCNVRSQGSSFFRIILVWRSYLKVQTLGHMRFPVQEIGFKGCRLTTSSLSLVWSLRNWVILDYAAWLRLRPRQRFLTYGHSIDFFWPLMKKPFEPTANNPFFGFNPLLRIVLDL